MSISLYFGLPGCGKTTLLTYFALRGVKNRRYKNVYSNVAINVPGVTIIDNSCIGRYQLENGLILIDEATLFADSRDYKNFSTALTSFILQHRHYNVDIIFFNQSWDALDKRIRTITDRVLYVSKSPLLGAVGFCGCNIVKRKSFFVTCRGWVNFANVEICTNALILHAFAHIPTLTKSLLLVIFLFVATLRLKINASTADSYIFFGQVWKSWADPGIEIFVIFWPKNTRSK